MADASRRGKNRIASLAAHLVGTAAVHVIDREADVVIVGGGVIGIATAYHLASLRPGLSIVLLENGGLGAETGSSYGNSRMYREVYSSVYCSSMQTEALKLWQELEQKCGQQLLQQHGLLFYTDTDRMSHRGSLLACQAIADQRHLSYKLHSTAQELNQQYPLNAKEGYQGLFEDGAGSINAKQAVDAMLNLAKQAGLQVLQYEGLADIATLAADQVLVTTTKGRRIKARQACLTAGAWTNDVLAHLQMQFPLEIWKVHWGHYHIDPALHSRIPQWYKFGKTREEELCDEGLYYGFPPQSLEPVVKVGADFAPCARQCRMQSMREFDYTPDHVVAQLLDNFLKTEWKGFLKQKDLYCSPYTMTSDGLFILDHLPDHPQICMFAGGNGRAFKFSILLGRCLADLLLKQQPYFDIAPLSATRDAVRPAHLTSGDSLLGSPT